MLNVRPCTVRSRTKAVYCVDTGICQLSTLSRSETDAVLNFRHFRLMHGNDRFCDLVICAVPSPYIHRRDPYMYGSQEKSI